LVVNDHPEDASMKYVVPADGCPLAGLADVAVHEEAREPLYLRCGLGLWLRRSDLPTKWRYRVLDSHHVTRTRLKLLQIAAGPLDAASAAWEDEADPEYHAWMAAVTRAVLPFSRWGGSETITLTDRDFATVTIATKRGAEPALAAAGKDPFADLIAPPQNNLTVLASPIPFPGPGSLWVVRNSDGATVIFETESPVDPPVIASLNFTGQWQPAAWVASPSGSTHRADSPWIEGQVRIRLGAGEATREIVVAKP
jgi:hypothetical protein